MKPLTLLSVLTSSVAVLLSATDALADSVAAVQTFATQMGSYNVITSGAFSTDNHVHGTVAVGGSATLSSNSEINSHGNSSAEALRVYGNLNLSGTNNKVISGSATVVKNDTVNSDLTLNAGYPNPNQATIIDGSTEGSLMFNGNGGTPTLNSLASADAFFTSRDSAMQSANATLLATAGLAGTQTGNKLSFDATGAGLSVFTWNIDDITSISEVGFSFATDSFIVVNIVGDSNDSVWNAGFNILGGSSYLAEHVLWNLGVSTANLSGSELLGSILAPDTVIDSAKQLNGSIYADSLFQRGQEIHYSTPDTPSSVPEIPSAAVLVLAGTALGAGLWGKRRLARR